MEVFHSDAGFENPRLHPYVASYFGHAGFVDLKLEPDRIPYVLEDFAPLGHEPSIQTFFKLLRWVNGPESVLETCDCALLGPEPHNFDFSDEPLSVHGRLMLMYRDLGRNCDGDQVEDLYDAFHRELMATDQSLKGEHGAIGLSLSRSIYRALSPETPNEHGALMVWDSDPGQGHQLMLLFQAFGRTSEEAFGRLGRVFGNLEVACRNVSKSLSDCG